MEKEKVDKKDHILDVAERVFAEQGYDGASTRMISGEAGVNMAMLNYYFGSKEGVFLAIFERRISAFQSTLVDINKDDTLGPWEKLAQFIDNYLNKVINNNCFHIMLNREVSKSKKTDLTDKITSIIMRNVVVFQDIIEEGIRSGAFNKDADKELLVATMFGTKNYIVNTPHISSAVLGYDVMDLKTQEDIIKPRLKNYMKTLFKAYLTHENDNK
jgi:AcrR family transcriptional regulator